MYSIYRRRLFFLAGIILFGIGCGQRTGGSSAQTSRLLKHMPVNYAHGFQIDYYEGYRELRIVDQMAGKADTLYYLLVDSGVTAPTDRPGVPVIVTPVRQFAVQSSVHVALADFVGVGDRIVGLGNFKYVNSPVVREGIRTGKVKEIGIDSRVNSELLISMRPGLLITMTNPDATAGQYKPVADAGIPVIPDAEWLETTPLGRAEWVKLIGALVNR